MKPVAWMLNGKLHDCDPSDWAKEQYPDQDVIPLYTAPPTIQTRVKYGNPDTLETGWITIETPAPRELSDEEILSLWYDWGQMITLDQQRLSFARAILKKASEK